MENIYFLMILALIVLAVADLVVGVSNDAVNFLNSALGSKAISFRTIMIVASLGIAFGAMFSSGYAGRRACRAGDAAILHHLFNLSSKGL